MTSMREDLKFNTEDIELVQIVGEILKSRTQSIKVLIVRRKDFQDYIAVQKWWRKSADEPWLEGKGFHLNLDEVEKLQDLLGKAVSLFESSK